MTRPHSSIGAENDEAQNTQPLRPEAQKNTEIPRDRASSKGKKLSRATAGLFSALLSLTPQNAHTAEWGYDEDTDKPLVREQGIRRHAVTNNADNEDFSSPREPATRRPSHRFEDEQAVGDDYTADLIITRDLFPLNAEGLKKLFTSLNNGKNHWVTPIHELVKIMTSRQFTDAVQTHLNHQLPITMIDVISWAEIIGRDKITDISTHLKNLLEAQELRLHQEILGPHTSVTMLTAQQDFHKPAALFQTVLKTAGVTKLDTYELPADPQVAASIKKSFLEKIKTPSRGLRTIALFAHGSGSSFGTLQYMGLSIKELADAIIASNNISNTSVYSTACRGEALKKLSDYIQEKTGKTLLITFSSANRYRATIIGSFMTHLEKIQTEQDRKTITLEDLLRAKQLPGATALTFPNIYVPSVDRKSYIQISGLEPSLIKKDPPDTESRETTPISA